MIAVSHNVLIQRSSGERFWFMGVSGCFLFLTLMFAFVYFVFPSPTTIAPELVYGMPGLFSVVFLSSFLVAGPTAIELNPGIGTYRYTRGMPLLSKTSKGVLTDISAVVCRYKSADPAKTA